MTALLWTALIDDPQRLEVELAKAGTTWEHLVLDIRDVPECQEVCELYNRSQRLQLALDWFGNWQHPQPPRWQRRQWPGVGYTPDFGRLHGLEDDERSPGRPKGSFVETETFWTVWQMAIDGDSVREIARVTDERDKLEFVNRDKAAVIVAAVAADRDAARHALGGRKTPEGFSATLDGIRLPPPEPA